MPSAIYVAIHFNQIIQKIIIFHPYTIQFFYGVNIILSTVVVKLVNLLTLSSMT